MDDTVDYCRQIESYLCRKNGGHLIRIVGPAFEKVRDWSVQGVPLKVAFRGIDRCCERAAARGGRRRPMRVEFCEADVLATFDEWRRALGMGASQVAERLPGGAERIEGDSDAEESNFSSRKGPLAAHIQRTVTRLLAPKGLTPDASYDEAIRRIIQELDELAGQAKAARGPARARIIERLQALDVDVLAAARARIDDRTVAALGAEADAELSGLAARMPADSLARARELAFERLLREACNLPVLVYE